MQSENRRLDDLARLASGALGVAQGLRAEVEARLRDQFERVLERMDLVGREEFEVVKEMARKAREEQEALTRRLDEIEARGARAPRARARKDAKDAPP